jgi:hypothetical protein
MKQHLNQQVIKPTWLYIKQHSITGLKYFGKTTRDPEKYKGSGKRWVNHLNAHGDNVKTIWSRLFVDKNELVEFALNFSTENNIVESDEWANLMPENGLDGGSPRGTNKGRPCSEQARKNLDNGRRNRVYTSMSAESKEKLRNSKLGKQSTHETREKLKLARARHLASDKIRYEITDPLGSMYIYNRLEIKQCCIVNDLTYASLLAKGKQGKLYKGWKATLIKS